ncbi:MAG: hypothetical protein MUO41_08185 [Methyloceanibacter sp.]|nr:hypothetical protein [Methyloceanibacter sp.]
MLKQACIAVAISALVLGFGGRPGQAGWGDAGSNLTLGASSPLVSVKKNKNHDDDEEDNDDRHHGKGNKNGDDGAGLSECTIQQSGGGGGCTGGFKRVCEKMTSGNKCCGCVPDKNQGTSAGQSAPTGGDKADSSSGGIKPVEQSKDHLLLP